MEELISPRQSETLVIALALLAAIIAGAWAWRARGTRAAIFAAICGAAVFPLWQLHKWLTRYDPQTGYFGLQSVAVLLGEIVLFVAIGGMLGFVWNKFIADDAKETGN